MWDVQSQEKKLSGKWVFLTGLKNQKYSVFDTSNCSKIKTVLNTLSGEGNFKTSGLIYCKTLF